MKSSKRDSQTKINQRIVDYMDANLLTPAGLSKQLGISAPAVYNFLKSNLCDVDRLWEISKILGYNFFAELADKLSIENPENPKIQEQQKEIEALQNEIKNLKTIVKVVTGREV